MSAQSLAHSATQSRRSWPARSLAVLVAMVTLATAAVAISAPAAHADSSRTYRITFTSLTEGQPLTPPVVALHRPNASLYTVGDAASVGVQEIAENGNIGPLAETAPTVRGVTAAAVAGDGPLFPGDAVTIEVTAAAGSRLSFVSMVVCTNDGFTGLDTVKLPNKLGAEATFEAVAYDAGTEQNIEDPAYWVPPCSGGEFTDNLHRDEGGVITMHPGLSGFDAIDFGAGDAMVQVDVERIG